MCLHEMARQKIVFKQMTRQSTRSNSISDVSDEMIFVSVHNRLLQIDLQIGKIVDTKNFLAEYESY